MKNLLIVPYGTPKWGIASDNMRSVLKSVKNLDVMYICPIWGLIDARRFDHSLLTGSSHINERSLNKTTALMIRSFLLHKHEDYGNMVLINYGQGMKYWNAGAQQTPVARRIKIVRYLPQHTFVTNRIIRAFHAKHNQTIPKR